MTRVALLEASELSREMSSFLAFNPSASCSCEQRDFCKSDKRCKLAVSDFVGTRASFRPAVRPSRYLLSMRLCQ